jgi:hypothetical protein
MDDCKSETLAKVSQAEMGSMFMFCKEWEDDPKHIAFRKRLQNTPGVNAADEIAKGDIVYDLMTGWAGAGYLHGKCYHLAMDIIRHMNECLIEPYWLLCGEMKEEELDLLDAERASITG